jgi:CubicO group peptidase (beta-lactamase class C family)
LQHFSILYQFLRQISELSQIEPLEPAQLRYSNQIISEMMNAVLFKNLRNFAAFCLILLITLLGACSKKADPKPGGETPPPVIPNLPSAAKDILSINLPKTENSDFSTDGYAYKSSTKIYITIPLNANLTAVKVTFNLSPKASIKIDGVLLAENKGTLDLSKTLTAVVYAENGSSSSYTILGQNGIKEIDAMIYPFIERYSIPAASYAVAKNSNERIAYKNAVGFAVVESNERARPDYAFRLASMSKQHTAIAIMKLIQDGKFQITDLVFGPTGILKDYFPSVGPMSAKVTVQHLLEHTAGYSGDPMFSSAYKGYTIDQLIQVMLNSAQSEPGTKYSYYNLGYGTLGKIIEVVSGKDYESYLKEIYGPAGITDFRLAATSAATRRTKEAACYAQSGNNAYGTDINVYKAAGGVCVNTEDLFKVLYAVDGGSISPDILNPTIRNLMFTKSTVYNYAKGWRTNHSLFAGYYHGGNLAGTATFWIYGDEYSAAVLLNSRSYDDNFDSDLIVLTNNIMKKAKELGLQ